MSFFKLFDTSKFQSDYSFIQPSFPKALKPEITTREKVVELFKKYSNKELKFRARYIGSQKIEEPKNPNVILITIDIIRSTKRLSHDKKRKMEFHMRLGHGVSVYDLTEYSLKLRFPVYKLVYVLQALNESKVFAFVCDISKCDKKCFRLYAFKTEERTAEKIVFSLREMYFVVQKIHRAKKRKRQIENVKEVERKKLEVDNFCRDSAVIASENLENYASSTLSQTVSPNHSVLSYISFHSLSPDDGSPNLSSDDEKGASAAVPRASALSDLDSMIAELATESKALNSPATNPFYMENEEKDEDALNFDDNFRDLQTGLETISKKKNSHPRVSVFDALSTSDVNLTASKTINSSTSTKITSQSINEYEVSIYQTEGDIIEEGFIALSARQSKEDRISNDSGSKTNSFSKLFQFSNSKDSKTNSYTKLDSNQQIVTPTSDSNNNSNSHSNNHSNNININNDNENNNDSNNNNNNNNNSNNNKNNNTNNNNNGNLTIKNPFVEYLESSEYNSENSYEPEISS